MAVVEVGAAMDVRLVTALLALVALAGCTGNSETTPDPNAERATAAICTNFGPIVIELYNDLTPITAQNFVDLAQRDYYDDVVFHRIISGFMMQGGDPTGTGSGGESAKGGTIPDEFVPSLKHDRGGLLSMANRGPNTGSSQFFITFVPTPWLDGKHTIFGEVTSGMDTVQRVEEEAGSKSGTPRKRVVMEDVVIGGTAADCGGEATTAPPTTSDVPARPDGPVSNCNDVSRAELTLQDAAHSVVAIQTDHGCIVAEMFDDKAPITVSNFLNYTREGFYTNLLFHRIIESFMVQTGGMQEDGTMKSATHPPIKNEAKTSGLNNTAYTLSMARTGAPDSATNQFFINTVDNPGLDPGGFSPDGYAVFGTVVSGRDVVDAIAATPVEWYKEGRPCQPDSAPSCPVYDVVLQSARILEA